MGHPPGNSSLLPLVQEKIHCYSSLLLKYVLPKLNLNFLKLVMAPYGRMLHSIDFVGERTDVSVLVAAEYKM